MTSASEKLEILWIEAIGGHFLRYCPRISLEQLKKSVYYPSVHITSEIHSNSGFSEYEMGILSTKLRYLLSRNIMEKI
jgi:hypothetical protein